jgi:CRP/FNR family transcriptional regulator/CRP/FNR family cyclic AMP-dependent transcriptional regulator
MSAIADLLQKVPFLGALSPEDRETLAASVTHRRFRKGDIIFQREDAGQALFIVENGSVRVYFPSPQGNDLTLAVFGPGDFFGEMSLLDGSPRSASASASADTVLLTLERSDFIAVLTSRPAAALSVLEVVSRRLRDANEMASDLAFLDVGGRLARKLLDLAGSHGKRTPNGTLLDLPLTQEELANMIGVTRESVNRNLGEFRRLGLVGNQGRKFVILDPVGLRLRSESSA